MGIFESFLGGALQGANEGYDYRQQQNRQQAIDDLQKRQTQQEMAIKQGTYDDSKDKTAVSLLQQQGQSLGRAGQWDQVGQNIQGPLSQHLARLGVHVPLAQGTPVPDTAGIPYQGPTPDGSSLGDSPATHHPNSFSNPQSQGLLESMVNFEPEKPIIAPAGSGVFNHDGTKLLQSVPYLLNPNTVYRTDASSATADKRITSQEGIAAGHDASGIQRTQMTQDGANGRNTNTVNGANWRADAKTTAAHSQALVANVHDMVTRFGGQVSSEGIRPVGQPGDTGATKINGHQTQYGLRYEYEHNGGALAAVPGTSDHGDGNAFDVVVAPAQQAAWRAEAQARGLAILDEGDHWHITAPGALASVARPTASRQGANPPGLATASKIQTMVFQKFPRTEIEKMTGAPDLGLQQQRQGYANQLKRQFPAQGATAPAGVPDATAAPPVSPLAAWAASELAKSKGAKAPPLATGGQ
jgi:hypothetical protein